MNWFHFFTAILIVAKIAGALSISWWWVFMPSIISIGLGFLFLIGILTVAWRGRE